MSHVIASVSMLKEVEKCSTSAFLKTQGLYPKSDPKNEYRLWAGIAIHEVLHLWLRKRSSDECFAKLVELYRPYSDKFVESNNAYHASNVERIMSYWLSEHPIAEQSFELVIGEYPRRAFIGANEVSDKSDGIVADKVDGTLMSIEHKSTGSQINAQFAMLKRLDPQFKQHVYVCNANGYKVGGVLLNAIQINKIPEATTKKCRLDDHKGIEYRYCWYKHIKYGMFPLMFSPEEMEVWRHNVEGALIRYSRLITTHDMLDPAIPQEGIIGDRCGYCDYRDFCHASNRTNFTILEPRVQRDDEDIIHSGVVND